MTTWADEVDQYVDRYQDRERDVVRANADMVRRVIRGQGPDKATVDPAAGGRAVVNLAAVHVPGFCNPKPGDKAYKNTYDLGTTHILGETPPGESASLRALVDEIIRTVTGADPRNLYFAAVEVNGTGIRFYGDVCLVLKPERVPGDTAVLNSNSYDLIRPPLTPLGSVPDHDIMKGHLEDMSGVWQSDVGDMAVMKPFQTRTHHDRRLTTGQVSNALLEDEDYLEVLKVGTFSASDLQEARASVADTAAEAKIFERLQHGPCPSLAELQWRKHRLAAVRALQTAGVRTRVVTTSGRVRG